MTPDALEASTHRRTDSLQCGEKESLCFRPVALYAEGLGHDCYMI